MSGQDDHTRHLFAGTNVQGPLPRNGFWRVDARALHDTGRTERTALGVSSRVGYQWRRLSVEGGARLEHLSFTDSDQDRMQLFVGLRHSLGKRTLMGGRP